VTENDMEVVPTAQNWFVSDSAVDNSWGQPSRMHDNKLAV